MSDVKVNSVQPSEVSKEMVALLLLGSVAQAKGATVNSRDGVPYIESGMTAKEILASYADCAAVVKSYDVSNIKGYISRLPD